MNDQIDLDWTLEMTDRFTKAGYHVTEIIFSPEKGISIKLAPIILSETTENE